METLLICTVLVESWLFIETLYAIQTQGASLMPEEAVWESRERRRRKTKLWGSTAKQLNSHYPKPLITSLPVVISLAFVHLHKIMHLL